MTASGTVYTPYTLLASHVLSITKGRFKNVRSIQSQRKVTYIEDVTVFEILACIWIPREHDYWFRLREIELTLSVLFFLYFCSK